MTLDLDAYHGTRNAGEILRDGFRPSRGGEFGPGVYFSESPYTASFYAERVAIGPEAPSLLKARLRLDRPYRVKKTAWIKMTERSTPGSVRRRLERQGYDSILGEGINGIDVQVVVFHPEQILSVRRARKP